MSRLVRVHVVSQQFCNGAFKPKAKRTLSRGAITYKVNVKTRKGRVRAGRGEV